MANFKLYFNEDDIRRIRLDVPSWELFRNKLQQLYPEYAPEMTIKYKDEEGDQITVTTGREWDTMLATNNGVAPIKLFIGNTPQPVVQVTIKEEAQEEKESEPISAQVEVSDAVVESTPVVESAPSLSSEESGEKEEDFQMVEPKEQPPVEEPSAETTLHRIDMDICVFFEKLHQACAFLNPNENETIRKAKEFIQALVPESPSPIVEELNGAVQSVKRALSDGYSNLRDLPEFRDVLEFFSGKDEDADPKKWASQHETLQSMGFMDVEQNEALLTKYRGNLQRVIDALLAASA